ncbi:MAG: energy-coupling factor transporter transmembrane protein EcfT [Clostridia bacterium]|nr:energy-coupling factor transporter transmembrane protein EcfT [Clostridia bacterium]
MRSFEDYHPLAQFLYFLAVSFLATFFIHPCLTVLSVLGALSLYFVRNGDKNARSHVYYLLFFAVITLINPLFRHNGATVLFVLNHNPITLESLLYGVFSSGMLLSVMYWFRSLSQMMSADKLLYLFGKLSPRLALIVSMALRYVPLFVRQAKRVHTVQRTLGLYREENLIDNTRGAARTMSVMTTWALENGIITADSMSARGYGTTKRTIYHLFHMRRGDIALLCATVLLSATVLILAAFDCLEMSWYPYFTAPRTDAAALICYIAYGLLALLPTALEIGGRIRWKYLHSKI